MSAIIAGVHFYPGLRDLVLRAEVSPAERGYLYLRAASGLIVPPDDLAVQGQDLVYRLGCFHCHGLMGAGGSKNLGSPKGYIPGWWGRISVSWCATRTSCVNGFATGRLHGYATTRSANTSSSTNVPHASVQGLHQRA